MTENCELDCRYVCESCGQRFCDIKTEFDMPHENELDGAMYMNCGSKYCHYDCALDAA